jgi:preprotein translocase subunit YajC
VELLLPLILVAFFVVMVILPMRTRNRQLAATRQMQSGLGEGAEVMTTSGAYGRIVGLGDDSVDLEIAPGVVMTWARAAIAEVRTPAVADPVAEPVSRPVADDEPGPA